MWEKLFASRVFILIGTLALAIGAFLIYLRIAPRGQDVYVPGPTSVQKVYETKWRGSVKPEIRFLPIKAAIEFLPRDQVVKESKIQDAPEDMIAVGQVPPHTGKTTVFGTLKPGADNVLRGGLEYRQEATKFWQLKREMGLRGGYGTEGIVGEVYVRPLRLGPAEIEARVYGRSGKVGMGAEAGAAVLVDAHF
jgi:hypothetical protein